MQSYILDPLKIQSKTFYDRKYDYHLIINRSNSVHSLLVYCKGSRDLVIPALHGLPKILEMLKEKLTMEDFLEVQKFCFENI